jgi:phenylacetate-CoA ligase
MSAAQDFQHQFFDMLMESQYWPEEVMVAYQRSQLEQLLRHARATVPFYENRLDVVFNRDGSIDWDRWPEIPILKRADVLKRRTDMLSLQPISGHGPSGDVSTSGSTGHPITVRVTRLMVLAAEACRWRYHRWHELDWSKRHVSRLEPGYNRPDGFALGPWGPPWDESAKRGVSYNVSKSTEIDGLLDLLTQLRPAYFQNGAKRTLPLVDRLRERGETLPLEAILAYGEGVGESDREAAMAGFGALILEPYSTKESGAIAHQCPAGRSLHVNSEVVFVEIVNDDDSPTAVGQTGRVIVTPFASTAQPIIRYDQGDRAVAGGKCSCGRCLPVIQSIVGRTTAIFIHPDGRTNIQMLPLDVKKLIGAGQLQLAQVGPNDYEVRYVRYDWGQPMDEEGFLNAFHELYFMDSTVRLVEVPEIPLTAAGKFIEYVNEWGAAATIPS